jgi:hypothetical protein
MTFSLLDFEARAEQTSVNTGVLSDFADLCIMRSHIDTKDFDRYNVPNRLF